MKVRTKHLIDSFKGEPMPCLLRTIMALEAQQAELNRKLSAARRAMKQKLKEGKRDNQPKASPETGRGTGKPGGS